MYGSGDTGRGKQVIFEPKENTTKDELREQGEELAKILKPIFPADFVLFITFEEKTSGLDPERTSLCI